MPGDRSSVAILTGLSPSTALAYLPISSPAFMLSVANSASTALCGSVGVSSAMTSTPLSRAFWMAGTMALVSLGVIRMPLTPWATMFSIAVCWVALSVSNLPAAVDSLAPLAAASLDAPSFIFTKNGLVSVFVMRPTPTWLLELELELPWPPQAARARRATKLAANPRMAGDCPSLTAADDVWTLLRVTLSNSSFPSWPAAARRGARPEPTAIDNGQQHSPLRTFKHYSARKA